MPTVDLDATTVVYGDTTFELGEPSIDVVIRMLNVVGALGVRAQGALSKAVASFAPLVAEAIDGNAKDAPAFDLSSLVAPFFGLLAVLHTSDVLKLGSAALQFEDDMAGRKWLKEHGLQVGPLLQALAINVQLSSTLIGDVRDFLASVGLTKPETLETPEIPVVD